MLGVLVVLIVTSPGWPAVRESFFNTDFAQDAFPNIVKGLKLTVLLFVTAEPVILVIGLMLAVVRGLHAPVFTPLRFLAIAYADVVRGIPTILLVLMFGFGLPALNLQGLPDSPLFWGWFALVVSYSAYVAEVLRAGLESVHPSQRAAARALGLNECQSLRFVVIPQAVRRVIPPLLNDFIALQKDTALVAIVGAGIEMTRAAQIDAFDALQLHPVRGSGMLLRAADCSALAVCRLDGRTTSDVAVKPLRARCDDIGSIDCQLQDVHKAYGDNAVLRGVSLDIDDHEVVALIGASGCGKSTLLRCINLLEPIDAGAILLDGVDISWPGYDANTARRQIGIVFQSFNLFPHRSVIDNITLAPRKVLGLKPDEATERAMQLLTRFGLADKASAYPDHLSGGQQQRVAIVRALAMQPQIMLFDEITSALDPELVGEVLEVIRDLKDNGLTMMLATHEMAFAREIATRVAFLDRGEVAELGPPDQVLSEPQQERTRRFLRRVTEAGRL